MLMMKCMLMLVKVNMCEEKKRYLVLNDIL